VIKILATANAQSSITIELGPNPQLVVVDNTMIMSDMLIDPQIPFKVKDRIWEILFTTQSTAIKMGALLSLGLEEEVLGPLAELLLADSRSGSGGCRPKGRSLKISVTALKAGWQVRKERS
jgi:hypothetical protein